MLEPTEVKNIIPELCICGNTHFDNASPYYTHQVIELPEIKMEVTHFVLHKGQCPCCGKVNKAVVPNEHRTGYGPRLSAMIAQMTGNMGDSRTLIQDYCTSVLGFHISLGAIQKVIDRASEAIKLHYESIGKEARQASVNYIDETSHRRKEKLEWLWVMANTAVAFFMIHPKRSKKAFEELIKDWMGVLVSDGYGVYRKWVGQRQTCLAHLIRKATELSESRANLRERETEANFLRWEDGLTKFSTKKVEIDENLEVGNGMSEGARSWMKFGKQNPLSCLDVFCGAMILSGLPTPSEQG